MREKITLVCLKGSLSDGIKIEKGEKQKETKMSNLPNDHINHQKTVGQVLSELLSALRLYPFLFTHLGLNVVSICMNMGNALLKSACASACKSSK
jgi:hypothetical protein